MKAFLALMPCTQLCRCGFLAVIVVGPCESIDSFILIQAVVTGAVNAVVLGLLLILGCSRLKAFKENQILSVINRGTDDAVRNPFIQFNSTA